MARYVALLRGINVGGNRKVEMKRLKALYEKLGFKDVVTFINSGNIFFTASGTPKALTAKVEKAMKAEFGFEIPATLRTAAQLKRTTEAIKPAWINDADQMTYVFFLWPEFDKRATLKLLAPREGVDTLLYVPGAVIWHLERKNAGRSAIKNIFGTPFYRGSSSRNANSTRKMNALIAATAKPAPKGKQKRTV